MQAQRDQRSLVLRNKKAPPLRISFRRLSSLLNRYSWPERTTILARTATKHFYIDEILGDVNLQVPNQCFPSRTILTCGFRRPSRHECFRWATSGSESDSWFSSGAYRALQNILVSDLGIYGRRGYATDDARDLTQACYFRWIKPVQIEPATSG